MRSPRPTLIEPLHTASDKRTQKANKSKYVNPKTDTFRRPDRDRRYGIRAKDAGKHKPRVQEQGSPAG